MRITALQAVNYDKRTDTISPSGAPLNAAHRGYVHQAGYTIVEPVTGWAPHTHLIEVDDFDLGHRYYLASLAE